MYKTKETLLAELPSYICAQLDRFYIELQKTQAEAAKEADEFAKLPEAEKTSFTKNCEITYRWNAQERMKKLVSSRSLNQLISNDGHWEDRWLGVQGKGIFIEEEFRKKALEIAENAKNTWAQII